MKDALKSLGARIQLIGLLPNVLAIGVVAFVVAAEAPIRPLSAGTAAATASAVGASGALLILLGAVAVAVTLQPLQFRLVQLLEGYWPGSWVSPVYSFAVGRQRTRYERLQSRVAVMSDLDQNKAQRARHQAKAAVETLRSRYPAADRLLPTSLGNALRAFEDRVGNRYGIQTVTLWPRLWPLLPEPHRSDIEDEVTQLDTSSRLAVTWAIAGVATLLILLLHPVYLFGNPRWIIVPVFLAALSWLSYRSAIESALAHGLDVEVALDLYRSRLIDAMNYPEPARLADQRRTFEIICRLFGTYHADHSIDFPLHRR